MGWTGPSHPPWLSATDHLSLGVANRCATVQVLEEPLPGESRHGLELSGLLEEVGRAGNEHPHPAGVSRNREIAGQSNRARRNPER